MSPNKAGMGQENVFKKDSAHWSLLLVTVHRRLKTCLVLNTVVGAFSFNPPAFSSEYEKNQENPLSVYLFEPHLFHPVSLLTSLLPWIKNTICVIFRNFFSSLQLCHFDLSFQDIQPLLWEEHKWLIKVTLQRLESR